MAGVVNADTIGAQLEAVAPIVEQLFENDDTFLTMLEKRGADDGVEIVSSRNMRLPVLKEPGGKAQQTSMDGGSLGDVSGPKWDVAQVTPFYWTFGLGWSRQSQYATDSKKKSVANVVKDTMEIGMQQMRMFLDALAQTGGDGVIGTITAAGPPLTMAEPYKANLVYDGMPVQVFNAALSTDRGSTTVTAHDLEAGTVTLAANPGGTAATDKLVIEGLAATVTIQSSLFGLKYHHSNASSGLWLNLDRAVLPQIRTPRVNGNAGLIQLASLRQALNKVRQALGVKFLEKERLVWWTHPAQEQAYEDLGISVQSIFRQPGAKDAQLPDLMYTGDKQAAGIPLKVGIHADRQRWDAICLSQWGRAQSIPTRFLEVEGNRVFMQPDAGNSTYLSNLMSWIETGFQVWTRNPRKGAYVDNLIVPTGA